MRSIVVGLAILLPMVVASAEDATIRVDVGAVGKPVSRYLTGACIEDVNHEIYGGIYSQMIFGESFQEPPAVSPIKNFTVAGGRWEAKGAELHGEAGEGPKLVSSESINDGEVGVELYLPGNAAGNAGLIVRVNRAGAGADNFDGYEIAIYADRKTVMLGRHAHNFKLLKEAPCDVGPDRWISLSARLEGKSIEVLVDGKSALKFEDDRPLKAGAIGVRQWQRAAVYKNLWMKAGDRRLELPFEANADVPELSGMWTPIAIGTAKLQATIERDKPFIGNQSQRISVSGEGEAGIANEGLNHWGLAFVAGKPYDGFLWLRAEQATEVWVSLESRDGATRHADQGIAVEGDGWKRYDFAMTPRGNEKNGRFTVRLKSGAGSVVLGHAFLQPGEWGRFKGLPVRRDVVEGLIAQGVTVLRYGGSMVNTSEYRWKKMIGPRDRRPPYTGLWYAYSTNGWGIPDFLNVCEAAGFLGVPDFNLDESPQDMADFIEYANGPAESEWGNRRVADGHPTPYGLKFIELGNEERVDEVYFKKFAALATAIWAKDAGVTLVVGDFAYNRVIGDPMKFTGADSRITSLAAHKKILALAKEKNGEVWFDVHVDTDKAEPSASLKALPSYLDAIDTVAEGAKHKGVVFELNANNPLQRRALGNAVAIGPLTRDGRLPIVTSANCLQPDGQNDNGWNQGLLFLNPSKVWLTPPGYVTQMIARSYEPIVLPASVTQGDGLDVTAVRSDDGKKVALRVVNLKGEARSVRLQLDGFVPKKPTAEVDELAAPLDATNTAAMPDQVKPKHSAWNIGGAYVFPAHSFTVIQFE